VTTAVVPVAGLGTRLLPLTRAVPKELLPVGGRPVIEHVVAELARSGVERIVLVTARGKEAIVAHLQGGDLGVTVEPVLQPEPRGLGDAVLCAAGLAGDAPFAVALGDAILGDGEPHDVTARLARALDEHGAACAIAVREVAREHTSRYGIVVTDGGERVTAIVEKPDPATASSTLAVSARYVMTPAIFDALRATPPGARGELELTDAIARLVADGHTVVAVDIGDVSRHDIGNHESYAAAFLAFALADADYGDRVRRLLDDAPR
jgi:UTP--glucose-1-phosphate uridylyltransferase